MKLKLDNFFFDATIYNMNDENRIKATLKKIKDVSSNIESTAYELEKKNFEPFILTKIPGFLRMSKNDVENYITNLWNQAVPEGDKDKTMSDDEYRFKQSEMVIYQFSLICRLRDNETAAWDHIYELYEDD